MACRVHPTKYLHHLLAFHFFNFKYTPVRKNKKQRTEKIKLVKTSQSGTWFASYFNGTDESRLLTSSSGYPSESMFLRTLSLQYDSARSAQLEMTPKLQKATNVANTEKPNNHHFPHSRIQESIPSKKPTQARFLIVHVLGRYFLPE